MDPWTAFWDLGSIEAQSASKIVHNIAQIMVKTDFQLSIKKLIDPKQNKIILSICIINC